MKFKLGGAVSDRSVKLLLIVASVFVALFAAFQIVGILGGQENVDDKEQELAEASLMSRLQEPLKTAARSVQDASKTSGETLPKPVLDKMKELYAVKPTAENGKRSLRSATSNDLMARLGINARQAQFIIDNRKGVESVDDFSDRRRNLFDANADTIEPMILQRIAQIAGRSGIQKLDFVKVEQQTKISRSKSVVVKPSPTSIQDEIERVAAVREALSFEHSAPLQEALGELLQLTLDDPSVRNSAESSLKRMAEDPYLSADKVAQLRLASLASQPSKMRILDSLLRTHLEDGLSRIPPEPEPEPEPEPQENAENEAENESEGEEENAENEAESANAENGGENAEKNEANGSEESANGEGEEENAASENGEKKEDANDGEADNAKKAPAKPPAHLVPIKFGAYPYPQLAQIKPAAQKRLMETLRDNQAAWLSDDQLRYILDVKEEEPAPENENQEEGGGENAENGNEEETPNNEENGAQEPTDANENESEDGDQEPTDANENKSEDAGGSEDVDSEENADDAEDVDSEENADDADVSENENESENANGDDADTSENANGEAEGDENGNDESGNDETNGDEEKESGPAPFTHPDIEKIRAYHVKLIDALWRISEAVEKPSPAKPLIYTASTEFRARIENLTKFVYQLEGEAPWMRISQLNLTKHNEDGPTLLVRVTVKATIF